MRCSESLLSLHSHANHSACARYHSPLSRASGCTAVFAALPRTVPKEGCLFGGNGVVWRCSGGARHGTGDEEAVDDNDVTRVQEEASTPTPQSASYHNRRAVLVTLESESSLWISPSNPSDKGPYTSFKRYRCVLIFSGASGLEAQ